MTIIPDDICNLFSLWYAEAQSDAKKLGVKEPAAMSLATVDQNGQPSVRIVLLKHFDAQGFVFYTNYDSDKGRQLVTSGKAALGFFWDHLERQVRIEGSVEKVSSEESDAYFHSRPRDSQIGAWASSQSRPMSGPMELVSRVASVALKHAVGTIPRPPHWGGFRVIPSRIEFWQGKLFRLHDRFRFERDERSERDGQLGWNKVWLFP